jgi:peptidyl-prolyl cis-trans isomerase D
MLQSIRDRAQGVLAWVIVTIISIPFALWGIHEYLSPSSEIVIADINGTEINRRAFDYEYRRQLQMLRNRLGTEADLSTFAEIIKQNVLNEMIEEELLTQVTTAHGMRISNQMLAQEIQNIPVFQENGMFSTARYEQALQFEGMSPNDFEFQVRRGMLIDQLQQAVIRSEILPTQAHQEVQRLQQQQRLLSYIRIDLERFNTQIDVSDADIQTYFDAHQKDYYTQEKVRVDYIELSPENIAVLAQDSVDEALLEQRYHDQIAHFTTPVQWNASHILINEGDNAEHALQQAHALLARVRAGEDFAALATEFSADTGSAKQGGDLGTFGTGVMVAPFEQALAQLNVGELSEPVKTSFGYHLIKLNEVIPEVVRPFAEVREELLTAYLKEEADRRFYEIADQFANLAFEHPDSLDILAETMGLKKQTSDFFDRMNATGSLRHPKVTAAAFSDSVLKDGMNSEVIEIDDQHLLVLRLNSHEEARLRPLAEVRDDVIKILQQQNQRKAAQQLSETIVTALKDASGDRHAVAAQHNLTWSEARWIKRQDQTLEHAAIVREVFKLGRPQENDIFYTTLPLTDGEYAVVALLAVKDAEDIAPVSENDSLTLGEAHFKQVTQALKQQAKIKLYPDSLN